MKRAYLLILASFVWLIGGGLLTELVPKGNTSILNIVVPLLLIGFVILFLIGAALWSKAKGYHPIVGVILGWIGPLGLLILVFIPVKTRV